MSLSKSLTLLAATIVSSAAVPQLGYTSLNMTFRLGLNCYRACKYRDRERKGFIIVRAKVNAIAALGELVLFPSTKTSRSLQYATVTLSRIL